MTTSKEIFLNQKDLRSFLAEIVSSEKFAVCLVYAKSQLLQQQLTSEEMAGAQKFELALMTLPFDDQVPRAALETGLIHNLQPVKPIDKKKE